MLASLARSNKLKFALVGAGTAGVGAGYAYSSGDDCIEAPHYHWSHHGALASFDYASVRRGFQVYREVCASCHSLERIAFRNLVDTIMSKDQAKKLAKSYDVEDGPGFDGEMYERPGRLSDYIPGPYKNKAAAAAANNGAAPPDLSLIAKARHGGADYLFALLTGYYEAPEGKEMAGHLAYNPYFTGAAIAMERQLQDGQIEYEDGTPCTTSQMAKDVSTFLAWTSEPEHDERKRLGLKVMIGIFAMTLLAGYYKRLKWAPLKSRKLYYINK